MRNEHEDLYLADAARDAARWEEAVSRYRSLLEVRPTESGLLVQLGHCHKEAGQFALAERAYLQAKVLRPDDMDVLLQLGHLYKISGRRTEAIAHYRTAIAGGLNDEHAKRYLEQNTTVEPLDGAAGLVPSVFLECSDLLEFLRNHRFPTGIQRVQIELLKAAALHGGDDKLYACTFEPRLNWWIAVGLDELTTLFEQMVDSTRYSDAMWEAAQAEFRAKLRRRQRLDFSPGATLINIGTSWWITDYMALIRNAKADCGLRFVPLVYDLIPMIVPQYVGEGMSAAFSDWAFSLFMHADLVAAISQSTARDIARIAARVRPAMPAPVVMSLDANPIREDLPHIDQDLVLKGFGLRRSGFVLFVGTLEIRKDHLLVFQSWLELLADEAVSDTPLLVCVGKRGWKFEQAQEFLDSQPEVADHVLLLSGISDLELHTLYESCLFTVYASQYEGWGLPVTESLCHGKICVTTDHSSLPEAGGRFAIYYEAGSYRSLAQQLRRLILDRNALRQQEGVIRNEYRPRSWGDVLADLLTAIEANLSPGEAPRHVGVPLEFGTRYVMRALDRAAEAGLTTAVAGMMKQAGDWFPAEEWGTWAKSPRVKLRFDLPQGRAGQDLAMFLQLRGAGQITQLTVRVNGTRVARFELTSAEMTTVRIMLSSSIARPLGSINVSVSLMIESDRLTPLGELNASDDRSVAFGISGLMVCPVVDTASRLTMIEHLLALQASAP